MRFIVATLIWFCAVSATGDTVPITSGEHDGYTRLVLSIDPTTPWVLEKLNEGSRLRVTGTHDFQLASIFDRIPKTRLKAVSAQTIDGSSDFLLTLNCACDVNAYAYQSGYIIVDISDAPEGYEAEIASNMTPKLGPNFLPDSPPNLDIDVFSERPSAPHYALSEVETPWPEQGVAHDLMAAEAHDAVIVPTDVDPQLQKTVDEAREALIRQLSFAADQGLLEFRPDDSVHQEVEPELLHEEASKSEEGSITSPLEDPINQEQVNIQSVYDIDGRDDTDTVVAGPQCFSDFDFEIQNWGSGEDFSEELSELRSEQLGEFDVTDVEKIEGLIKLYIRYSFDVEARYLIGSYREEIHHAEILNELAYILSGTKSQHLEVLRGAIECGGAVGMWALASEGASFADALVHQDSVLSVFENLPADLRRLIGPRLIEAYLRRNMTAEAQRVADLIARAYGDDGERVELSQAELQLNQGHLPVAEDIYQKVISANTAESLPALIELVELYLSQGRIVPPEYRERIMLESDTHRGKALGLEFRALEVQMWVQNGDEEIALAKLVSEIAIDPENEKSYRDMGSDILSTLTHDNPDFLTIAMSSFDFLEYGADNITLRTHLAEEALLFGFPNAAAELLEGVPEIEGEAVRNLIGLIAIADNNTETAEGIFKAADNEIANQKLLEIYISGGKFEQALAKIDMMNDPAVKLVNPDWFSGSWRDAIANDPAALTIFRLYLDISDELLAQISADNHQTEPAMDSNSLEYFRRTLTNVSGLQEEIATLGLIAN